MSIECGECEMDLRSGHDESCSRYDPRMADCICDPEWHPRCPVHTRTPITPIRSSGYVGPSENEMRNGIMPKPGDTLYEEAPTTPTSPNEGAP